MKGIRKLACLLGKTSLAKSSMLGLLHLLKWVFHWRHRVIKRIDGISFELDLNQLIDSDLYFLGAWEFYTAEGIKKCVRPGDTVIDIGANIGAHTLLCSKLVGTEGRVIAFEPMSWANKKLARNVELNPELRKNITIERFVVSDKVANKHSVSFRTSWALFGVKNPPCSEEVCSVTLDDYARRANIKKMNLIKIDVDGFEYKVLHGARNVIYEFRPTLVLELCTYSLRSVGDNIEDLLAYLKEFGYGIILERDWKSLDNLSQVLDLIPENGSINVFCKH